MTDTTKQPPTPEIVKLSQVQANAANPRSISGARFQRLVDSLLVLPKMLELRPIVVDATMTALGGNMRYRALCAIADMSHDSIGNRLALLPDFAKKPKPEQEALLNRWLAWRDAPTAVILQADRLTDAEAREFIIKDNVGFGEWDYDALANEWDEAELKEWGLNVWQSDADGLDEDADDADADDDRSNDTPAPSLVDRFIVPPFSILDTRKGYWQRRKKVWREIIGDAGETREGTCMTQIEMRYPNIYYNSRERRKELGISFREYLDKYVSEEEKREDSKVLTSGVSLFDPVLAEVLCKWFTPSEGSKIFDPFAGDTQKGLVFATCGHTFRGIELRQEQVDVNERVIEGRGLDIAYVCDDGRNVAKHVEADSQDLLFSCPPYYDVEVYSDLPNDASNQGSYEEFLQILRDAFHNAIGCLKNNRFAVVVVGDVRDKRTGCYYDLVGDVKRIFKDAGMPLYNEVVLIESGASTALRVTNCMKTRKMVKCHQNVLVFYKGDPRKIKSHFPAIEYTSEEEADMEATLEADTND
jgi:DNA modification methylase